MKKLIEHLPVLGYSCEKLNIFIWRGDFGDNKKIGVVENWIPEFYEYCIMLKKYVMLRKPIFVLQASFLKRQLIVRKVIMPQKY